MLLFQGDIMLEGSLVRWKRGSQKGFHRTARSSVCGGSTSLQASSVSLFKGPRAKKDLRRSQSFGGGTRSSWTQTMVRAEAQPRAMSKNERIEPEVKANVPEVKEAKEEVVKAPLAAEQEVSGSMPLELKPEEIPGVVNNTAESQDAVQLSGFDGDSSCLNGTFTADGTELNGKQVYSQGEGSQECMWYHNGAWRIGSYNWLATKDLGRCHAFVKTEHDLDHLAATETWMSCGGLGSGGDPDAQDGSIFQPQMSARAAKLALDNVVKRSGSKKVASALSNSRLTNILTDQFLRHDMSPPTTPPGNRTTWSRGNGSKDEANMSMSNPSDVTGT